MVAEMQHLSRRSQQLEKSPHRRRKLRPVLGGSLYVHGHVHNGLGTIAAHSAAYMVGGHVCTIKTSMLNLCQQLFAEQGQRVKQ